MFQMAFVELKKRLHRTQVKNHCAIPKRYGILNPDKLHRATSLTRSLGLPGLLG